MDVDPPAADGDDPKPKQKSLELFEDFCTFAFVLSFVMAVGGIACTWLVPDDYNLGQVLNVSLQFFEAQVREMSGKRVYIVLRLSAALLSLHRGCCFAIQYNTCSGMKPDPSTSQRADTPLMGCSS
jgi:hypothetical protein